MLAIPVQAVPSQTLAVLLAGQDCRINLYQRSTGLYLDLYLSGALVIGAVPCLNANRVVRSAYLGFTGDLAVFDTQGSADPDCSGLGARWLLVYLEAADIAGL